MYSTVICKWFWGEVCKKFDDENVFEKFWAIMEFCKIYPWTVTEKLTKPESRVHSQMIPVKG
jgi:hypothetical protein